MRKFKLFLGRTVTLETEGEEAGSFDPDSKEERYMYIAFGKIGKEGEMLQIAFQPCHAQELAKSLKADDIFTEEVHIEVWKYHQEKLMEFNGTLFDALLVAANEGAKYDI